MPEAGLFNIVGAPQLVVVLLVPIIYHTVWLRLLASFHTFVQIRVFSLKHSHGIDGTIRTSSS
jgi:hypothetical protein